MLELIGFINFLLELYIFILIAAAILAARRLAQYSSTPRVPATVTAISDAIRFANEIMCEIDRLWPTR